MALYAIIFEPNQSEFYDDENKVDKPLVLLVTKENCKDCDVQETLWKEFVESSEYPVTYKKIEVDDPAFKESLEIVGITSFPSVVTMTTSGEVISVENSLMDALTLSKLSQIALEGEIQSKFKLNEQEGE